MDLFFLGEPLEDVLSSVEGGKKRDSAMRTLFDSRLGAAADLNPALRPALLHSRIASLPLVARSVHVNVISQIRTRILGTYVRADCLCARSI